MVGADIFDYFVDEPDDANERLEKMTERVYVV